MTTPIEWAAYAAIGIAVCIMAFGSEETEERHCGVCRKKTRWDKKRGCLDCSWADRQW